MIDYVLNTVNFTTKRGGESMSELAILRMRSGCTQKAMAEKIGLHVATLSVIERRRFVPNASQRQRIASAYGVNEADFFDEKSGLAI